MSTLCILVRTWQDSEMVQGKRVEDMLEKGMLEQGMLEQDMLEKDMLEQGKLEQDMLVVNIFSMVDNKEEVDMQ